MYCLSKDCNHGRVLDTINEMPKKKMKMDSANLFQ